MSLFKYYLTILDVIRKTAIGTIEKDDFDRAYDAFIEISLYAREFGTKNNAVNEVYSKRNTLRKDVEQLYKREKSENVADELIYIDKTNKVFENAIKGDLLVKGLSDVLTEVTDEKKHYENFPNIDFWTYEKEEF